MHIFCILKKSRFDAVHLSGFSYLFIKGTLDSFYLLAKYSVIFHSVITEMASTVAIWADGGYSVRKIQSSV